MSAPKDWQDTAEEAILDYFRFPHQREPFHPDFLEHVIPDEHRGVISRAVMALVNKRWIVKCGRRKSTIASRKGAEANEYRLTELGRDRIAGVGGGIAAAGSPSNGAATGHSPHSGDRSTVGVTTGASVSSHGSMGASSDPGGSSSVHGRQRAHGAGEPRPNTDQRGRDRQVRGTAAEAQPARLFDDAPPSAYDPYSEAA